MRGWMSCFTGEDRLQVRDDASCPQMIILMSKELSDQEENSDCLASLA